MINIFINVGCHGPRALSCCSAFSNVAALADVRTGDPITMQSQLFAFTRRILNARHNEVLHEGFDSNEEHRDISDVAWHLGSAHQSHQIPTAIVVLVH